MPDEALAACRGQGRSVQEEKRGSKERLLKTVVMETKHVGHGEK